jgi:AcrR family transcriptional regulator
VRILHEGSSIAVPRIVDHERRRREIAEAAWAVINRSGTNAASLQRIAAEIGSTTGSVTHYFSNKEELISFTFDLVTKGAFEYIESAAMRAKPGLPRVRITLERMAPTLFSGSDSGSAVLSYWGLAVSEPMYAHLHRKSYAIWEAMLRRFLREASGLGQLSANLNLDFEASILMTFVDGLVVGGVLEPRRVTRAASRRMLGAMLSRLEASSCDTAARSPLEEIDKT